MNEKEKEEYRGVIKLLGPKRMKALTKLYEKHGNFYLNFAELKKYMEERKKKKKAAGKKKKTQKRAG